MLKLKEISEDNSCWNKALPEERVFILLARDESAPAAIFAWIRDRINRGSNQPTDPEIIDALKCAEDMRKEQGIIRSSLRKNPEKVILDKGLV